MRTLVRAIGGIVVGYAAMVALITLVQETWLGGVAYHESSASELLLAGSLTCLAGGLGAALATLVGGPAGRVPGLVMAAMITLETTTLALTGVLPGPLWFDVLAASSLMTAVVAGAEVTRHWRRAMRTANS